MRHHFVKNVGKDKSKRFCKDCKNYLGRITPDDVAHSPFYGCRVADIKHDVVHGEIQNPSNCLILNRDFDCPHYTPFGAERIAPGHIVQPVLPWWKELWLELCAIFRMPKNPPPL